MHERLIIKLGGSVITDKSRTDYNVQTDIVEKLFTVLQSFKTTFPNSQLVLVHGAGGHIHHLAKAYELTTSCAGDSKKIARAKEVQATTKRLSDDVVTVAHSANFPIKQIPTCSVVTNTDGLFNDINLKPVITALENNSVPLLYGDMVTDTVREFSICSGDSLVAEIASQIKATGIVYVSDIDGLFTDDPFNNPKAELIETISVPDLKGDHIKIGGSHNADTTGGLAGKLHPIEALFANSPSLVKVEICNGLQPEVLQAVLAQTATPHTTIQR